MTLCLDDGDVRLYHGDALETLRGLPDGCVDMVATSPPFYGLRDYGTGTWEGGDEGCDHKAPPQGGPVSGPLAGTGHRERGKDVSYGQLCGKCGARRVDQQIGLEETPDEWVARLVAVFRECRRVLADHGTLWVEIGDSYMANQGSLRQTVDTKGGVPGHVPNSWGGGQHTPMPNPNKPKDLLGQPWLLAFALRADGWYLRSEIIWARPNPMPESMTDRPTKSHSTVFLLSKKRSYFYDADAIREAWADSRNGNPGNFTAGKATDAFNGRPRYATAAPKNSTPTIPQSETLDGSDGESPRGPDGRRQTAVKGQENSEQHRDGERWPNPTGANARSVWTIPTEPTPFAHFATWPRKLVARMILAGTSERGKCPVCGKPWVRDVERTLVGDGSTRTHGKHKGAGDSKFNGRVEAEQGTYSVSTLGWSPSCAHDAEPVPCRVLDPFAGSGTTLLVARQHGRHAVGIELNAEYLRIAADRLSQLSLLTEAHQ